MRLQARFLALFLALFQALLWRRCAWLQPLAGLALLARLRRQLLARVLLRARPQQRLRVRRLVHMQALAQRWP
jgi:hypothetical protein